MLFYDGDDEQCDNLAFSDEAMYWRRNTLVVSQVGCRLLQIFKEICKIPKKFYMKLQCITLRRSFAN